MGNAIHLAPLVAEWRGTRTPTLLFGGRRGQLMTLDVYDNDLGNYNFAIIGAPGSGKSVLMNEMAWSYRVHRRARLDAGPGTFVREAVQEGQAAATSSSAPIRRLSLNPFSIVSEERIGADGSVEGGINEDIDMLEAGAGQDVLDGQHARRGPDQGARCDDAQAVQGVRPRPDDHRRFGTRS